MNAFSKQPRKLIRRLELEKTSRFRRLADRGGSGLVNLPGSPGGTVTFRTTRWLVPTTFSRGKDDHHRAVILFSGVEISFRRSEFWTAPS
jgi:hypothetical protein